MGYIIDVVAATDPDGLALLLKKALEYTDGGKIQIRVGQLNKTNIAGK